MLLKTNDKRAVEQITKPRLNDQSREILERQLEAFRAKFGGEPEANDPNEFLVAARKAGLPQPVLRYIEQNFDRDAVFDCSRCAAQVIAWAMSHPACPDCGHHPLHGGMIAGG